MGDKPVRERGTSPADSRQQRRILTIPRMRASSVPSRSNGGHDRSPLHTDTVPVNAVAVAISSPASGTGRSRDLHAMGNVSKDPRGIGNRDMHATGTRNKSPQAAGSGSKDPRATEMGSRDLRTIGSGSGSRDPRLASRAARIQSTKGTGHDRHSAPGTQPSGSSTTTGHRTEHRTGHSSHAHSSHGSSSTRPRTHSQPSAPPPIAKDEDQMYVDAVMSINVRDIPLPPLPYVPPMTPSVSPTLEVISSEKTKPPLKASLTADQRLAVLENIRDTMVHVPSDTLTDSVSLPPVESMEAPSLNESQEQKDTQVDVVSAAFPRGISTEKNCVEDNSASGTQLQQNVLDETLPKLTRQEPSESSSELAQDKINSEQEQVLEAQSSSKNTQDTLEQPETPQSIATGCMESSIIVANSDVAQEFLAEGEVQAQDKVLQDIKLKQKELVNSSKDQSVSDSAMSVTEADARQLNSVTGEKDVKENRTSPVQLEASSAYLALSELQLNSSTDQDSMSGPRILKRARSQLEEDLEITDSDSDSDSDSNCERGGVSEYNKGHLMMNTTISHSNISMKNKQTTGCGTSNSSSMDNEAIEIHKQSVSQESPSSGDVCVTARDGGMISDQTITKQLCAVTTINPDQFLEEQGSADTQMDQIEVAPQNDTAVHALQTDQIEATSEHGEAKPPLDTANNETMAKLGNNVGDSVTGNKSEVTNTPANMVPNTEETTDEGGKSVCDDTVEDGNMTKLSRDISDDLRLSASEESQNSIDVQVKDVEEEVCEPLELKDLDSRGKMRRVPVLQIRLSPEGGSMSSTVIKSGDDPVRQQQERRCSRSPPPLQDEEDDDTGIFDLPITDESDDSTQPSAPRLQPIFMQYKRLSPVPRNERSIQDLYQDLQQKHSGYVSPDCQPEAQNLLHYNLKHYKRRKKKRGRGRPKGRKWKGVVANNARTSDDALVSLHSESVLSDHRDPHVSTSQSTDINMELSEQHNTRSHIELQAAQDEISGIQRSSVSPIPSPNASPAGSEIFQRRPPHLSIDGTILTVAQKKLFGREPKVFLTDFRKRGDFRKDGGHKSELSTFKVKGNQVQLSEPPTLALQTANIIPNTKTAKVILTTKTAKAITATKTSKVTPTTNTAKVIPTTNTAKVILTTKTAKVIPTTKTAKVIPTTKTAKVIPTPGPFCSKLSVKRKHHASSDSQHTDGPSSSMIGMQQRRKKQMASRIKNTSKYTAVSTNPYSKFNTSNWECYPMLTKKRRHLSPHRSPDTSLYPSVGHQGLESARSPHCFDQSPQQIEQSPPVYQMKSVQSPRHSEHSHSSHQTDKETTPDCRPIPYQVETTPTHQNKSNYSSHESPRQSCGSPKYHSVQTANDSPHQSPHQSPHSSHPVHSFSPRHHSFRHRHGKRRRYRLHKQFHPDTGEYLQSISDRSERDSDGYKSPLAARGRDSDVHKSPRAARERDSDGYKSPRAARERDSDGYKSPRAARERDSDGYKSPRAARERDSEGYKSPRAARERDSDGYKSPRAAKERDSDGYKSPPTAKRVSTQYQHDYLSDDEGGRMVRPERRRQADPQIVQQLWDAIIYIRQQKQIPNQERIAKFMAREHQLKTADVEVQLQRAVHDQLVTEYTAVGFKGSRVGLEQEGYKLPDTEEIHVERTGHDWYCFDCHQPGEVVACSDCWRVYHPTCTDEDWTGDSFTCAVCKVIKKKPRMKRKEVNRLLSYTVYRLKDKTRELHKFGQKEDIDKVEMLVYKNMDLNIMEEKTLERKYKYLEQMYADGRTLLHNIFLVYGDNGVLANLGKIMIRDCKYDLDEMRQCKDCYHYSNAKPKDWFTQPCRPPHELVYAKQKGFSYWPAKVIKVTKEGYDVRFFGGWHQRAILPEVSVKPIQSNIKQMGVKRTAGFVKAMEELKRHRDLIDRMVADDDDDDGDTDIDDNQENELEEGNSRHSEHSEHSEEGEGEDFLGEPEIKHKKFRKRLREEEHMEVISSSSATLSDRVAMTPEDANMVTSSEDKVQVTPPRTFSMTDVGVQTSKKLSHPGKMPHKGTQTDAEVTATRCNCDTKYHKIFNDIKDQLEKDHRADRERALRELEERLRTDFEEDKQQAVTRVMANLQKEVDRARRQGEDRGREASSDEARKVTQKHKAEVSTTKKKQWCYNCEEEAMYHCCWNTSYCSIKCQQEHWHREHKRMCRRKRN